MLLKNRMLVQKVLLVGGKKPVCEILRSSLEAEGYGVKMIEGAFLIGRTDMSEFDYVVSITDGGHIETKIGESEFLISQGLKIDRTSRKCTIDGKEVSLTKTEMELLVFLLENAGKILSRENIVTHVWNDDRFVTDRAVDVNIARLRKKIGNYGKSIISRVGYGYGFDPEE